MALNATFDSVRSFDRTRIAYARFGFDGSDTAAPTVVLANGIACADCYWTYLVPHLTAGGIRVVYYDYRGHGRSGEPANPNEITVVSSARDLWAAADAAGAGDVVVVGHSMGVATALEAYRLAPSRVRSMILAAGPFEHALSTVYPAGMGRVALAALELAAEPVPWLTRGVWRAGSGQARVAESIGRATRMIGEHAPPEIMAEYFAHMQRLDPVLLIRMFRALQLHTARDLLPDVACPVLVLAGEGDRLTPVHTSREMAMLLPDVTLEIVPGARHTLPVDDPVFFYERVTDWVRSVWDGPGADPVGGSEGGGSEGERRGAEVGQNA